MQPGCLNMCGVDFFVNFNVSDLVFMRCSFYVVFVKLFVVRTLSFPLETSRPRGKGGCGFAFSDMQRFMKQKNT